MATSSQNPQNLDEITISGRRQSLAAALRRKRNSSTQVDAIIADPVPKVRALPVKPHPNIPLPERMFGSERKNSKGLDLSDPAVVLPLGAAMEQAGMGSWKAGPIPRGSAAAPGAGREVRDPADNRRVVGMVVEAGAQEVDAALADIDVMVLPALSIPAPPIGAATVPVKGGTELVRAAMLRCTQLFNLTGHPALSLPCGLTRAGLPAGLQLVGARRGTQRLLQHALAVERVLAAS